MEFAKCLKCGCEIEPEDTIEESINDDGSEILAIQIGECPKCGQMHMWDEVFEYSHFEDLHAIME